MKRISLAIVAFLLAGSALAQGPGPAPGPGPVPNPWVVSGSTISYSKGGITVPQSVSGGAKGVGSINAQSIYVNGTPITGVTISGTPPITATIGGSTTTIGLSYDTTPFSVVAGAFTYNQIGSQNLVANCTAGLAKPGATTLTTCMDGGLGSTAGGLALRNTAAWGTTLAPTAVPTINFNAAGPLPSSQAGTVLHVGQADAVNSIVQQTTFGASAFYSGVSYGGTLVSPAQTPTGRQIVSVNAHAYTGSAVVGPIASVRLASAEAIASGARGSTACLATTPLGSSTMADGFCQQPSGGVTVGAPTGGDKGSGTINVASALYVNGSSIVPTPPSGTSGGIPYFDTTTSLASSALLAANRIVLGGGAGTAPATLGSLGTTTTVLHGNAAGAPTFGAVSLTADVSGLLPLANGGTNANLTASNGGVVYSTASAFAVLSGTATARQMLQSGATAAPAWSTATWPATTTTQQILYSSAANTVAGLSAVNGGVPNYGPTGTLAVTAAPVLGVPGTSTGSIGFGGSTSGTATITAQATAGTPTLTLPNASGTFAVNASSPLVLSATTGALTCPTCATSSGGGAITGTAPVAVSAAGVVSITGAAGQVLAGASPAFTNAPALGVAGASVGSIAFANLTSGSATIQPATGALGSAVWTLRAATDNFVGAATTDVFTNKTYDTAGTGNVFKINGTTISAVTGTGSTAVLSAAPTLTGSPVLSTATATSISITGTGGAGFVEYPTQASAPAAPAAGYRLYADSGGRMSWIRQSDGFARAFAGTLTADRVFTLPDASFTFAGINLSSTWTAAQFFGSGNFAIKGATSGQINVNCAAICGSSVLTFPAGTTDFTATGGTSQVVKQTTLGGAFTVAQLAFTDISGTLAAGQFPALTGDVTTPGGSLATTLATVNSNVGSFGSSTAIPVVTVNGKGLVTAASTAAVVAPAGTLTGATLASGVTASSLTSVGTLTSMTTSGAAQAGTTLGISTDVLLNRDAAATLAQRNGVTAQDFRIYNTFTDASNYERGSLGWTANANWLTLRSTNAGTGSARGVVIDSATSIVAFNGVSSSFPAFKRNSTAINTRLADDSADATLTFKTQSPGDNTTNGATTAFVQAAIAASGGGNVTGPGSSVSGNLASFNGTGGTLLQDAGIAYSEGTFTPTMSFATPGTSSFSYSNQIGQYVKIGKIVIAEIDMSVTPTIGTGSGNVIFGTLPVAVDTANFDSAGVVASLNDKWTFPAGDTFVVSRFNTSTTVRLQGQGTVTNASFFTATNMTTGQQHNIHITLVYKSP